MATTKGGSSNDDSAASTSPIPVSTSSCSSSSSAAVAAVASSSQTTAGGAALARQRTKKQSETSTTYPSAKSSALEQPLEGVEAAATISSPDGAGGPITQPTASSPPKVTMAPTSSTWLIFALSSGACAAFNGVFAKLTTTSLTSTLAASLATALSLSPSFITPLLRAAFFGLNLACNALMWILFTRALVAHPSTTKVSIINTSTNFLFTAVLGWAVFSEGLQGLWFAGAALLVAGCVIIGAGRDENKEAKEGAIKVGEGGQGRAERGEGAGEGLGEGVGLLDGTESDVEDAVELDEGVGMGTGTGRKEGRPKEREVAG